MQLEEIKKVLASKGMHVWNTKIDGYYKVNGCGKYRSERSLMREAKSIVKQQEKDAKKDAKKLKAYLKPVMNAPGELGSWVKDESGNVQWVKS